MMSLYGVHFFIVEAGTKITDERSGQQVIVTDEVMCGKGNVLWVTHNTATKIISHIEDINAELEKNGVDTPVRKAHFLSRAINTAMRRGHETH